MGRERRVIDSDYLYHVVSRGNNRERIVRDRLDCELFCRDLGRVAGKREWEVWAWCLMSNHFHLVLRAEQGALSSGMQHLNGNNSRRVNRRHGRTGHLVQNRFFAVPLETEAHQVAAVAYVARNPVQAGLCGSADLWPFGGYRATVGTEPAPAWLAARSVLELFGHDRDEALRRYRGIVHSGNLPVSDRLDEVSRWERSVTDARIAA